MQPLKVRTDYVDISQSQLAAYLQRASEAQAILMNGSGAGNDYIGWVEYINQLDDAQLADIVEAAGHIKNTATTLLVIGIGGSYLGTKSTLEALLPSFDNESKLRRQDGLRVYFVGHQMSSDYLAQLLEHIKDDEVFVNVISKSGTTTEPAVAFRLIRKFLVDKYGANYGTRIVATTDSSRGALKGFADGKGIKTFVIPDDVGGRYSVFTPVGLLPIAAMGLDVEALVKGARDAYQTFVTNSGEANAAQLYAALRNYLYDSGHKAEILVNYNPALNYLAEWWKQLYGESEGKDGKGILPHAMSFTTDLHSLGQYVQDGERFLFETVIDVLKPQRDIALEADDENLDGLNYLAGKTIAEINRTAMVATILAHKQGGVPNIVLEIAELDAYHLGYTYYFFMMGCAISGYMLGVNPFNQPGVEAYKKNMFALLGKPGYEELATQLQQQIK